MRRFPLWLMAALLGSACQKKATNTSTQSASPAPRPSAPVVPKVPLTSGSCLGASDASSLDTLVPFTNSVDWEFENVITVDRDHVYFHNLHSTFRVPIAGGEPTRIAAPPRYPLQDALWSDGDKLISQSWEKPVFMVVPKSGGEWTSLIDALAHSAATRAVFDGGSFYWAETLYSRPKPVTPSTIKSIPLTGGSPRTLYGAKGEIRELVKAGRYLVFTHLTEDPNYSRSFKAARDKSQMPSQMSRGDTVLMSIPIDGGDSKVLMRFDQYDMLTWKALLGADGEDVYVTGFAKNQRGIFRIDASGARGVEQVDARILQQGVLHVFDRQLVFVGFGELDPVVNAQYQLVLISENKAKGLIPIACFKSDYRVLGSAKIANVLLLGLRAKNQVGGIVRLPLR